MIPIRRTTFWLKAHPYCYIKHYVFLIKLGVCAKKCIITMFFRL